MRSKSETGHAVNAANFQDLIAFVTAYGTIYNPSKNLLSLPQLISLKATADTNLADVVTKNTTYNNIVNERVIAFSNLRPLSTRLVNALQITDATKETIKDAKGYNRKMQGKRASKPKTTTDPNTPAPKTISSSQQSYDQLIQHLAGLISVLQSEPTYAPNETDLTIASLTALQASLTAKNNAVATAYTDVNNSRIIRNNTLYNPETGLVEIANEVKKYIKSIFGARSPEFKQVRGIAFTNYRI